METMKQMEDGPYYFANNQYVKAGTCFRKIGGFSDDTDRLKLSIVGYIDFITNNGGVKSADGWSLASCLSYVASGDWYICEDLQLIKNVITDVSIKPDLDKYVHLPKDLNGTIDSGPNVYVKTDHEILPIGKVMSDERLEFLKSIINPNFFQKEYEYNFPIEANTTIQNIQNPRTKSGDVVTLLQRYGWRVIARNDYRHITAVINEGYINGCPVTGKITVTGKTEVQKLIKSLKETTIF